MGCVFVRGESNIGVISCRIVSDHDSFREETSTHSCLVPSSIVPFERSPDENHRGATAHTFSSCARLSSQKSRTLWEMRRYNLQQNFE